MAPRLLLSGGRSELAPARRGVVPAASLRAASRRLGDRRAAQIASLFGGARSVEARLTLTARALARELNQVMGYHSDVDHFLDLAPAQRRPRHLPEAASIVGAHSHVPQDALQNCQPAGDV